MHNEWEEMLPFYVGGTLPKHETTRLENHLMHCETCQKSLGEWRAVAAAVRANAALQLRDLPPLSAEVMAEAERQSYLRGQNRTETLTFTPVRQARRAPTTLLSAVAAFAVILIGGLLALMLLRGLPEQGQGGVVLLPSATPTLTNETQTLVTPQIIVIEPSETPIVPTEAIPTEIAMPIPTQPTSLPPPTVYVPPVQPTRFVPQATPFVPDDTGIAGSSLSMETSFGTGGGGGGCTVEAMIPSGSVINLYARPRTDATVVMTVSAGDVMTALATSDNGWFQVQTSRGSVGWVQQGLVAASGSCDGLPMIVAETATEVPMTPTPTVIPFEPLPSEPAVTQNEAEAQSAATADVG